MRLPVGTRDERFEVLQFRHTQCQIARGEMVEVRERGALQQIGLFKTEITRETNTADLPAELAALLPKRRRAPSPLTSSGAAMRKAM